MNYLVIRSFKCLSKFSEIKQLLVDMTVIGETIVKDKWESGCLIRELGANQCRVGCVTCILDAKLKHLEKIVPDIKSGYGESQAYKMMHQNYDGIKESKPVPKL